MKALMIKDLAAAKQLDASDMSAIHGGSNFNFGNNKHPQRPAAELRRLPAGRAALIIHPS
jgi:hypothetical protein